jgi:hypothetical protein
MRPPTYRAILQFDHLRKSSSEYNSENDTFTFKVDFAKDLKHAWAKLLRKEAKDLHRQHTDITILLRRLRWADLLCKT